MTKNLLGSRQRVFFVTELGGVAVFAGALHLDHFINHAERGGVGRCREVGSHAEYVDGRSRGYQFVNFEFVQIAGGHDFGVRQARIVQDLAHRGGQFDQIAAVQIARPTEDAPATRLASRLRSCRRYRSGTSCARLAVFEAARRPRARWGTTSPRNAPPSRTRALCSGTRLRRCWCRRSRRCRRPVPRALRLRANARAACRIPPRRGPARPSLRAPLWSRSRIGNRSSPAGTFPGFALR